MELGNYDGENPGAATGVCACHLDAKSLAKKILHKKPGSPGENRASGRQEEVNFRCRR